MEITNLVPLTVDDLDGTRQDNFVFDIRPRRRWNPHGVTRGVLVLLLLGLGLFAFFTRGFAQRGPRNRDTLHMARERIQVAHKQFSSRHQIIESIEDEMARKRQELHGLQGQPGSSAIAADAAPIFVPIPEKMIVAKRTRWQEVLQALESRKDALTQRNVELLVRIRRAEVELIHGEQACDANSPVDGLDRRIEELLSEKGDLE